METYLLGKIAVNGADLGKLHWGHLHCIGDGLPVKPLDGETPGRWGEATAEFGLVVGLVVGFAGDWGGVSE